MNLRLPSHRRRAALEIDRLVKANPSLVAFPLLRVGVVAGITARQPRPAPIVALPQSMRRAA